MFLLVLRFYGSIVLFFAAFAMTSPARGRVAGPETRAFVPVASIDFALAVILNTPVDSPPER